MQQQDTLLLEDIITTMQMAVDSTRLSEHPDNKIAAAIRITGANNTPYTHTNINQTPAHFKDSEHFPDKKKLGDDASLTIHAEFAAVTHAAFIDGMATRHGDMFITDLPCPNCVKAMAEAGIHNIYIDHKAYDKTYAQMWRTYFDEMSLNIAKKAGMGVHIVFRKEERLETLAQPAALNFNPANEYPAEVIGIQSDEAYEAHLEERKESYNKPFATAMASDQQGKLHFICALSHPTVGYTTETMEDQTSKYSYIIQPLNRLMMIAAKNGLRIVDGTVYSSRVPTAREFVNFSGSGLSSLEIGDKKKARDERSLKALDEIREAGILSIS